MQFTRTIGRLSTSVLGAAALTLPLHAQGPQPYVDVARLTVSPPPIASGEFLLRGTLPIPAGTNPTTLRLVDYDGTVIADTQVEIVARRADGTADVVELLGRVHVDPAWNKSTANRQYKVYASTPSGQPSPPGGASVSTLLLEPDDVGANVQALVLNPLSVAIVARDSQGNEYSAFPLRGDHGAVRPERFGPHMSTVKTFEVMQRESPWDPNATLPEYPHMFNVEAYSSTQGEDFLLMDLVLSNGSDSYGQGANPLATPIGKMYFQDIDLLVPMDFAAQQQFLDPLSYQPGQITYARQLNGTWYNVFPLVRPEGGTDHVIGCTGQIVRRVVMWPLSSRPTGTRGLRALNQVGLGFATEATVPAGEAWSWWNTATANYFPQRVLLPQVDPADVPGIEADLAAEQAALASAILNGTAMPGPGGALRMGWAHPLGENVAYGFGGYEIHYVEGLHVLGAYSHLGMLNYYALLRVASDRMPNKLLGADGEPTTHDRWVTPQGYMPEVFNMDSLGRTVPTNVGHNQRFCPQDPSGAGDWEQNAQASPPSYESALIGYWPYDTAHLVRYTRILMALSWLANDPLAKDELLLNSELFRFTTTELPCDGNPQSQCTLGLSLERVQAVTAAYPHRGVYMDRGQGWGLNAVAAALSLEDDAFRASMAGWLGEVVQVLDDGMIVGCDPVFTTVVGGQTVPREWGMLTARPNPPDFLPDTTSCYLYGVSGNDCPGSRVTWHEMIMLWAFRGLMESAYEMTDPEWSKLRDFVVLSATGMLAPVSWSEASNQQWVWDYQPVRPHVMDPLLEPMYPWLDEPYTLDCPPFPNPCAMCPSQPYAQSIPTGTFAPVGGGNTDFYWLSAMAHAWELTADPLFLQRPIARYQVTHGAQSGTLQQQLLALLELEFDPAHPAGNAFLRYVNGSVMLAILQP